MAWRLAGIVATAFAALILSCSEIAEITITASPDPDSPTGSAVFGFVLENAASFSCSLDDGDFQTCESPLTYDTLTNGTYALVILARDAAGVELARVSLTFTISRTVPTVVVTTTPGAFTNATTTIAFQNSGDTNPNVEFECSADEDDFVSCTSPVALTGLTAGEHRFRIRLSDEVGNQSGAVTLNWSVDLIAPTLSFNDSFSGTTPAGASTTCAEDGKGKVVLVTQGDDTGGSGIQSRTARIDSGADSALGANNLLFFDTRYVSFGDAHTYTSTIKDNAGNETTITRSFTVTHNGNTCFDPTGG